MFQIVDEDGRRMDAGPWVYFKLTIGSGELKMVFHLKRGQKMGVLTFKRSSISVF